MELQIFLRLLLKRWWIVVSMILITAIGTLVFTNNQTPIYASIVTYVVSPSPALLNGATYLSGLSVLGGQPTVANTYASIAASTAIKQDASKALGLYPAQESSLKVDSRVQSGTNIIEISVEGVDPLLVQTFANKVGESTVNYVETLASVYDMKILDVAKSPDQPIRPNLRLNLILGIASGLVLGVGIAFLAGLNEY